MILGLASAVYSTDPIDNLSRFKVPSYNWKEHFDMGTPKQFEKGNNILHAKSTTRHYTKDDEAVKFIDSEMNGATRKKESLSHT